MLKVIKGDLTDEEVGQDLVTDGPKVRAATRNALLRAEELGLEHIAFPALKTGAGGLSLDEAAGVMVSEVRRHLACGSSLEEVVFTLFDEDGFDAFSRVVGREQVVCLGDSITHGFPYGPEESWVGICAKALGLRMVNKGINGDTTRQMKKRFEYDVVFQEPAYVIILGGANDVWVGVTLERYGENITDMVARAFDAGICPVLVLPTPVNVVVFGDFSFDDVGSVSEEMDSCREWIKEFASEHMLPLLDFYTPLLDQKTGLGNQAYFVDEGHPSLEGYKVIAGAAEKLLLNLKTGLILP